MIDTGAGVVDADYRGVVFVLLFNHSDTDFEGMRSPLAFGQSQ
jgi:dUTP pyrophosphatase